MIRKILFRPPNNNQFRHRGEEVLRIEGLSDAVFGFSISLLVAALEVPQTFTELKVITNGAVPFFLTVTLIFIFWYRQYIFFRRYGLNDFKTILLNLAYLAVIIFYIYPLKFLFSLLLSSWGGIALFAEAREKGLVILANDEFPQLIILFSIGYFLIWLIIYLLHQHVLKHAVSLSLNRFEKLTTQKEVSGAMGNAIVALLALAFAYFGFELMAGICYLLIPVILLINHLYFRKRISRL